MPFHIWPSQGRTTRREFLAGLTLGGAALGVAQGTPLLAEDGHWLALVSDTHLHANPRYNAGGQLPAENLRLVIADILAQPTTPCSTSSARGPGSRPSSSATRTDGRTRPRPASTWSTSRPSPTSSSSTSRSAIAGSPRRPPAPASSCVGSSARVRRDPTTSRS